MRHTAYVTPLLIAALLMLMPTAGAQQADQSVQDQGAATPAPNKWTVSIRDFYFDPADAAIAAGDTIIFLNEGAEPHTVTSDDGQFDSGPLNPGESFPVSFDGEGTVTYHCQIHPEMVGSVTVSGTGAPAQTTSEPTQPVGETVYVPGGTLTHYESIG
jgi:plastocyanin